MSGFIAKQPNGLYCRFSTVVDCPTRFNMTKEDYIESCVERARQEAIDTLENHLKPFDMILSRFYPNNMEVEEFNRILKLMGCEEEYNANLPKEDDDRWILK